MRGRRSGYGLCCGCRPTLVLRFAFHSLPSGSQSWLRGRSGLYDGQLGWNGRQQPLVQADGLRGHRLLVARASLLSERRRFPPKLMKYTAPMRASTHKLTRKVGVQWEALFAHVNTYIPCVWYLHVIKGSVHRSLSLSVYTNLLLRSPPCLFLDLARRALFADVLDGGAIRRPAKLRIPLWL